MRVAGISSLLLLAASAVQAASSWTFGDATVSISNKKIAGEAAKESFEPKASLKTPVSLGAQDTLTITLTAKDNGKAKRPHQAFLLLQDQSTGLEAPFPLSVRDNGKGKVQITQKDIPTQFFAAAKPIHAAIVLASFGSSEGLISDAFDIKIITDANSPPPAPSASIRYGKQPQIHHIFQEPVKYGYKVISLAVSLVIAGTLPLVAGWLYNGANLNHLAKAIGASPLSYTTFLGSIVGLEFVYFLYHRGLSLGHILVPVAVLSTTTVLSGMRALGEVQGRRLAGER
ncbi:hypothetical protein BD289DRAFT_494833 [Coniella lustricola]|uniref:Ribophorin II C-terminal domain-containing protein n=1 Tax=Coniella lustricola TaxID=2025994 RepID=A0A2T3AEJ1_9PEZI|nr:hypothetical protein BD289DRAFT_494833 [Coniella lustricola]